MENRVSIRRATETDIPQIARINAHVFLGHRNNPRLAKNWVRALSGARCEDENQEYAVYLYFVIEVNGKFAGYIGWQLHGGFSRPSPAVELEQLGIDPSYKNMGMGTRLTEESLTNHVVPQIQKHNKMIESHITCFVWFYADNQAARKVYEKSGFTEECGERRIYGSRKELCLKREIPFVIPTSDD